MNIEVRLNTEATVELIAGLNPYAVILATGSTPIFPAAIPGIQSEHVVQARALLDAVPAWTDEKVAVIGGGMVGLEVATTFAHMGCDVSVVEMQPREKMPPNMTYRVAYEHAVKAGCALYYGHKLKEIGKDCVTVEDGNGMLKPVTAGKVILCMGFRPDAALYDELSGKIERVYKIGDANGVDNIAKAAREGYAAALEIN